MQTFDVPVAEQYAIKANDVVGIFYPNSASSGVVTYEQSDRTVSLLYFKTDFFFILARWTWVSSYRETPHNQLMSMSKSSELAEEPDIHIPQLINKIRIP